MTQTLLALISEQGALILFVVTFLSCLAMPVPASLMMLTAGAFVASSDLSAPLIVVACLSGAVLGDQVGFALARRLQEALDGYLSRRPKRAALMVKARAFTDRWGGPGVFFSRCLVSPLGPYVNLTAGATGLSWPRFLIWDILGEITWVLLYLGLGYLFASQLTAISNILLNLSGLLAALVVTLGLGLALLRALRHSAHDATRPR